MMRVSGMTPFKKLVLAVALPTTFALATAGQAAATRSAQVAPAPDTSTDAACAPKVDAKGRQKITRWQRRNCPDLAGAEQKVPRKSNFFAIPGLILGAAAAGGGAAAATSGGDSSSNDSPGG
jgi:hypothetical protein